MDASQRRSRSRLRSQGLRTPRPLEWPTLYRHRFEALVSGCLRTVCRIGCRRRSRIATAFRIAGRTWRKVYQFRITQRLDWRFDGLRMKPLPAPSVPGNTDAEPTDNAIRNFFQSRGHLSAGRGTPESAARAEEAGKGTVVIGMAKIRAKHRATEPDSKPLLAIAQAQLSYSRSLLHSAPDWPSKLSLDSPQIEALRRTSPASKSPSQPVSQLSLRRRRSDSERS
jgi:hypothetical protein